MVRARRFESVIMRPLPDKRSAHDIGDATQLLAGTRFCYLVVGFHPVLRDALERGEARL
jgi:hypothetical protein